MKTDQASKSHTWFLFLLVFFLSGAGIVTTGYLYYRNYEQHYRAEIENQLSAIAALKVGELAQYRKERMADGGLLFQNAPISALVRRFLAEPAPPRTRTTSFRSGSANFRHPITMIKSVCWMPKASLACHRPLACRLFPAL